jgi:hypothetical protein
MVGTINLMVLGGGTFGMQHRRHTLETGLSGLRACVTGFEIHG